MARGLEISTVLVPYLVKLAFWECLIRFNLTSEIRCSNLVYGTVFEHLCGNFCKIGLLLNHHLVALLAN